MLYCKYGREKGFKCARVRSPDSDIFFILLYYARYLQGINILFETGKGNNKRIINVTKIAENYSQVNCVALLGLHAFTGCNSTSAFKGKGKVKAIKLLQKKENYQMVFARLGEEWDINEDLLSALSEFTCALYGKPRLASVKEVRYCRVVEVCGRNEDETLRQPKTLTHLQSHLHMYAWQNIQDVQTFKLRFGKGPICRSTIFQHQLIGMDGK